MARDFLHTADSRDARPASGAAGSSARTVALLLAVAALALLAVIVYWQGDWKGVRGEFLGQDHALFQYSPLLEPPAVAGAEPALPRWLPRAVTTLSLALDRSIRGPFPAGFRESNMLLHALATLAAFALFLQWSGRRLRIALPAALLFAVHPIHAETVSVVGARGEILASLFAFLSLVLLDRARPRGGGALVPALALFFLATFSSPTALAVPVFILVHDAFSAGGFGAAASRWWMQWMLFAATALPSVVLTLIVGHPILPSNAWLAGRAALLMMWLQIVPVPPSTYRILGPVQGAGALSLLAILGAVALVAATVVAGRRLYRATGEGAVPADDDLPVVFRGWLFALVPVVLLTLLPPVAPGPDVPFTLFDSRLYLPSAGMCLALAAAIVWTTARLGARAPLASFAASLIGALVAVLPYVSMVRSRLPEFQTDADRYVAAANREPRSAELRLRLARAAADHGRTEQAIQVLAPVLEMRPNDARLRLALGNFHRDVHDLEKAESEVHEALRIDPSLAAAHNTLGLIERDRGHVRGAEAEYREAVRLDSGFADAHSNLGALLVAYGSSDEAMAELRRAVALDPTHGDAAANLASFLLRQNLQEEALSVLREGLRYSEGNARLHYHVGVVLQRRGDDAGAESAYWKAIDRDPTYARPMNNLAVLLTQQKRYEDAIALLQRVADLEPQNEQAHYNLGIAYRLSGDKVRAAAEFGAALKLRPEYPEASRALSEMAGGAEPPSLPPSAPLP